MSIFKKLNAEKKVSIKMPIEPIDLYSRLKKDANYFHLRGIQEEALNIWSKNRDQTHTVLKMNTGSGKTLVGLLMLYSKMIENHERSLFLCPDNQLVSQVYEQSKNYGIPTCIFEDNNEFPEAFLNNSSILITTVQKLFNSKNVFDRDRIKIGSILFDDAHKCVEKIQDQFTLRISRENDLYLKLFALVSDEIRKQEPGSFEGIVSSLPVYFCKLPFWTWNDIKDDVIKLLKTEMTKEFLFKWDFFISNYDNYEFFIDSYNVEISPIKCNPKNVETYLNCKNVFAMSATFENDNALLYHLDFSLDSILNPVEPKNRNDYGQRLILSPKRYFPSFDFENLKIILQHHRDLNQNILVIVPSYRYTELWKEQMGAEILSSDIEEKLTSLKNSTGKLYVIVNRYDGIDLSGNVCNILILHDHPSFKYISDRHKETLLYEDGNNLVAQAIEQGLGRTVRGGSDYSVIYLLGVEIQKFLRNSNNFKSLNKHTKRQIEIGLDLLKDVDLDEETTMESVICETADSCLNQSQDWLDYYQDEMDKIVEETDIQQVQDNLTLKKLERDAINYFLVDDYTSSIKIIRKILELPLTDQQQSMYFTLAANIYYYVDKNSSNDLLIKAKKLNYRAFQPFLSSEYLKALVKSKPQLRGALNFLRSFTTLNDYINYVRETISFLKYSPDHKANRFEQGVKQLGLILGYQSFRPEQELNEGPDNVWILDNNQCLVIECKSEKKLENGIIKADIAQLYHSIEWFKGRYFSEDLFLYGVTMQYNNRKEDSVTASDLLRIIDGRSLDLVKQNLEKYINFLRNKNMLNDIVESDLSSEFHVLGFETSKFLGITLNQIK